MTKEKADSTESALCGKRDLNPYGVNHTPLKRARLPVPPLPHSTDVLPSTVDIISRASAFVKGYFEISFKKFGGSKAFVWIERKKNA